MKLPDDGSWPASQADLDRYHIYHHYTILLAGLISLSNSR